MPPAALPVTFSDPPTTTSPICRLLFGTDPPDKGIGAASESEPPISRRPEVGVNPPSINKLEMLLALKFPPMIPVPTKVTLLKPESFTPPPISIPEKGPLVELVIGPNTVRLPPLPFTASAADSSAPVDWIVTDAAPASVTVILPETTMNCSMKVMGCALLAIMVTFPPMLAEIPFNPSKFAELLALPVSTMVRLPPIASVGTAIEKWLGANFELNVKAPATFRYPVPPVSTINEFGPGVPVSFVGPAISLKLPSISKPGAVIDTRLPARPSASFAGPPISVVVAPPITGAIMFTTVPPAGVLTDKPPLI